MYKDCQRVYQSSLFLYGSRDLLLDESLLDQSLLDESLLSPDAGGVVDDDVAILADLEVGIVPVDDAEVRPEHLRVQHRPRATVHVVVGKLLVHDGVFASWVIGGDELGVVDHEIKVSFLGLAPHHEEGVDVEVDDLGGVGADGAVELQCHVEGVDGVLDEGEAILRGLAAAVEGRVRVVLLLQGGDHVVEITSEELKVSSLPIVLVQLGVEHLVGNGPSDIVLKEPQGDERLNSPVSLGVKNRVGDWLSASLIGKVLDGKACQEVEAIYLNPSTFNSLLVGDRDASLLGMGIGVVEELLLREVLLMQAGVEVEVHDGVDSLDEEPLEGGPVFYVVQHHLHNLFVVLVVRVELRDSEVFVEDHLFVVNQVPHDVASGRISHDVLSKLQAVADGEGGTCAVSIHRPSPVPVEVQVEAQLAPVDEDCVADGRIGLLLRVEVPICEVIVSDAVLGRVGDVMGDLGNSEVLRDGNEGPVELILLAEAVLREVLQPGVGAVEAQNCGQKESQDDDTRSVHKQYGQYKVEYLSLGLARFETKLPDLRNIDFRLFYTSFGQLDNHDILPQHLGKQPSILLFESSKIAGGAEAQRPAHGWA